METLSNDKVSIQIAGHGAELVSIVANDTEYLWQADPKYWGRHSPVLFPIVGKVWNNIYRHKGHMYELGQHGFARAEGFVHFFRHFEHRALAAAVNEERASGPRN